MAGRPKRRARLAEYSRVEWERIPLAVRRGDRRPKGCSTRGYALPQSITRSNFPATAMAKHLATLPRFLATGQDHTTGSGRIALVTVCIDGRLYSTFER